MLDGIRETLEQQVARLLEEAERPMTVEEILPHLDPVFPTTNDVADVLHKLAAEHEVEREGSLFAKATPVPLDVIFPGVPAATRAAAEVIVEILRKGGAEGVAYPVVVRTARKAGIAPDRVLDIVTRLKKHGEAFTLAGDRLRLAKA